MHRLARDLGLLRRYGPGELRSAVQRRFLRRLYSRRRGRLFEQELADVPEVPAPAGVEIRRLEGADWPALAAAFTTDTVERLRRRDVAGSTCVVAWRGDRPVGFARVSDASTAPRHLPIPVPADTVYGWDLWVDPRERSGGIGSALVGARLAAARELGYRRAWRVVIETNEPALRTVGRTSARVLGTVVYETLLGRTRIRFEPAAG